MVPDSLSSVFLGWDVNPTDGYQCISSYNIQVTSQNGSQWGAQISGMNSSFLMSGLNLVPLEEYTYCVTANIHPSQVGPSVKHVSSVKLHGRLVHDRSFGSVCIVQQFESLQHQLISKGKSAKALSGEL